MEAVTISAWQASGLTDEERETFAELLNVWRSKLARNSKKLQYYNMKNKLKDLGISIPPPLKNVETVVGWPAKAVDYLAVRSIFDGFRFADNKENPILNAIIRDNDLKNLYAETVPSELIMSCSFLTVTKGGAGEPAAIISAYDASTSAALWDYRRKRIKCGIAVVDIEEKGGAARATQVNMFTDTHVIELSWSRNGRWTANRMPHSQGRPLMEPLRFKPTGDRPFGRSRVNRAVMSITDSAVREAIRSEVAAEFAAAPQKWLMGADDSVFSDHSKWEAYIGSILALTRDDEGNMPQIGQFPQLSMQPHTEYMRSLAARFAGETSIPISSLGIVHDNPSSAESMYAAREDLVIEAENLNSVNATALERIGLLALAIAQNKTVADLTEMEHTITASFKNPARPSAVSQSDAIIKQISALPWLAESDVALEELGYGEDKIMRLREDRTRAQGRQIIDAVKKQRAAEQGGAADGPS